MPGQQTESNCHVRFILYGFAHPPLQAKTLLKKMQDAEQKEATLLESKIALLEHVEQLLHGQSYATMPRQELRAHVAAVVNEGYSLPSDLRMKLLERTANDVLGDLMEVKDPSSGDFKKLLAQYLDMVLIWKKGQDVDETKPTWSFVWDGACHEIAYNRQFGKLSAKEAEEAKASAGEVGKLVWVRLCGVG